MKTPLLHCAAFVALSLLLSSAAARSDELPAADSEAAPGAAPAKNLPGVTLALRTRDGQTRFQQGETIPLVASFSSQRSGLKVRRYVTGRSGISPLGAIHVSPQEGAVDPQGELPPVRAWIYAGPPPPSPVALGEKPFEIPFVLNDWVRFDRPGTYRVFLTTSRVFEDAGGAKRHGFAALLGDEASETTSNVLQLEIVPTDPAWAHAQVEAYRDFWKRDTNLYSFLTPPPNDISFLGTREAMEALIERLGAGQRPRSSEDETRRWQPAFVRFAERDWLISAMHSALARPDTPVTQGFLDTLALLEALRTSPRPAGADASQPKYTRGAKNQWVSHPTPSQQLQMDWEKRFFEAKQGALAREWGKTAPIVAAKSPSARAMSLHTLLELAWLNPLGKAPAVQTRLPQLVAQLAPVFDLLPPLPQEYLLGDEWPRLKSPQFLPALERLWKASKVVSQGHRPDLNDLVLRRLYEISPDQGRAILLREIAAPHPRVSIEALRILPDATLPALDQTLVDNLENPSLNDELPAQLIARYASRAAAPRLKKIFENRGKMWESSASTALHAYFLRAAPAFGKRSLEASLDRIKTGDYSSTLAEIAAQRMTPELERIAIAHLNGAGVSNLSDAAQALAHYGSPRAEAALLARLKQSDNLQHPQLRERIEIALVDALADAQAWLCEVPKLQAIRALCHTASARNLADEYIRSRRETKVHVDFQSGERGDWNVEHYIGRGLENLRAKLAQFPRGTLFSWQTMGFGKSEEQVFRGLQGFVAARGMKLERG